MLKTVKRQDKKQQGAKETILWREEKWVGPPGGWRTEDATVSRRNFVFIADMKLEHKVF